MKEIWNFLKWQWSQWSNWQKVWLLGCMFIGAGVGARDPIRSSDLITVGIGIWMILLIKWAMWDGTKEQWKRYKKEKAALFKTIEEGK